MSKTKYDAIRIAKQWQLFRRYITGNSQCQNGKRNLTDNARCKIKGGMKMLPTVTYIASNGVCVVDTRPEAEIIKGDEDYLHERAIKEKMRKLKENKKTTVRILHFVRRIIHEGIL